MSTSSMPDAQASPLPEEAGADDAQVSRSPRRRNKSDVSEPVERIPVGATVATVVSAGAVGVVALLTPVWIWVALAAVMVVLALTWPILTGMPQWMGPASVMIVVAAGMIAATTRTTDPFLQFTPLAVAVGLAGAFVFEMTRRDGREGLVESLSMLVFGVALVAFIGALIPMGQILGGAMVLSMSLMALGMGALADIGVGRAVHAWMLPVSMLLGAAAAVIFVGTFGGTSIGRGALIGVLVASISHVGRRAFASVPGAKTVAGPAAIATGSIGLIGVMVYALGRIFLL